MRTIMKRQTDAKLATQWAALIKIVSYALAANNRAFVVKTNKPTLALELAKIDEKRKETDSVKVKFKL